MVIDDVLTPAALDLARRACLEQSVWYDGTKKGGYTGAYLHTGFHAHVLLQIAKELKEVLPEVIGVPRSGDGGRRASYSTHT